MSSPRIPPAFAIGAQYDTFLQHALRRFFDRARLDTESLASPSSDGRLSIEPTKDPHTLSVRWFGTRYILRVAEDRPFTSDEVRFARAIGDVLSSRFHAILNPASLVERGGLFTGAIEDRYVGAFFNAEPYAPGAAPVRVDRLAEVIEILRVAALSSYEDQPISTGVLLLGTDEDPVEPVPRSERDWPHYTGAMTSIKSFFRLADGMRTVFLVGRDGRLLDIVDVKRWGAEASRGQGLSIPCAQAYAGHARATLKDGHVAFVLSPQREIKVFARGAQLFAFRNADWHLLDLAEKYRLWERAVGAPLLALRLFQIALDLSNEREGALFVVLRHPMDSIAQLVSADDRLDMEPVDVPSDPNTPSRRHLLHVLAGRSATELDPSVLAALATLDGAIVTDRAGQMLAVGAILRHPPAAETRGSVLEGARTTAAHAASRFGPVLKVSEDGLITFYDGQRVWDI